MALGHDIAAQVPFLRQQAESLMVDTATVTRPGGEPSFDPNTGALTPATGTVIYQGPCRLSSSASLSPTSPSFGEQQVTQTNYVASFPHTATAAAIGDLITFDTSDDPDVTDRTFRITSVPAMTYNLYKGYPCEVTE